MPEIKFKAWNRKLGVMCWAGEAKTLQRLLAEKYAPEIVAQIDYRQFTGLCDKNGVEIYAGDVLDIENEICEVRYNAPGFAAYNSQKHEWNIQYTSVEIIGNAYENPDLIGK